MTSSLLSSFLFGIAPAEPWVYSATMALLIGVGLLATLGPTVRATHIDGVKQTGNRITSYSRTTQTCTSTCHGSETW